MESEQVAVKSEIEKNITFGNLSKPEVGKESLLSVSAFSENPLHWTQLLDELDCHEADNNSVHSGVGQSAKTNEQILIPSDGLSVFSYASRMKNKSQQMKSLTTLESVALQNNDLMGWPLFSPYKPTLLKCEKCSQEFCSAINHRRHCRVHRKSLNNDKDSLEKRKLLGAYWDKLSLQEAREILSLKEASIENVAGSLITKNLTSSIRKPGFLLLTPTYVKAGSILADIIAGDASEFPLSSEELFSILDDASERTFLSCGNAPSLQKYLFGGNPVKFAFETKNLVACTSFLIEQELIKAWVVHKEAESLRYEQLLVEEEEAAHKRQADILEKKRLKKLRQKEKQVKEPAKLTKAEVKLCLSSTNETTAPSAETLDPIIQSGHCLNSQEGSQSQELNLSENSGLVEPAEDLSAAMPSQSEDVVQNQDPHDLTMRQQHSVSEPIPGSADNFYDNTLSDKTLMDGFSVDLPSGLGVGDRHMKSDGEEATDEKDRAQRDDNNKKCNKRELLIGSILITLEDDDSCINGTMFVGKEILKEMQADKMLHLNAEAIKTVCHDNDESATFCESKETKTNKHHSDDSKSIKSTAFKGTRSVVKDMVFDEHRNSSFLTSAVSTISKSFTSKSAENFLSQRWKKAMAAQHMTFVASTEIEDNSIK